jgi:hypothetical protein
MNLKWVERAWEGWATQVYDMSIIGINKFLKGNNSTTATEPSVVAPGRFQSIALLFGHRPGATALGSVIHG